MAPSAPTSPGVFTLTCGRPVSCLLLVGLLSTACGAPDASDAAESPTALPAPLQLALVAHTGGGTLDDAIRSTQQQVRQQVDVPRLERLATLFIQKARTSGDPGFYRQAEACARAMPTAGDPVAGKLVLGHVRHALHDFAAAEVIARELVAERGLFLDHGLLGDVLLDLGRVDEARDVYQCMLDLKPCLQSYARAAQLRWLVGDAEGTRVLLESAAAAGSRRDPESLAWVLTRRASLALATDDARLAEDLAEQALALQPDYPSALAWRGRAALALADTGLAVRSLTAAVAHSPLPEHLWAQADALRAAGELDRAVAVEAQLQEQGEREDARGLSLWLSTCDVDAPRALRLAEAELIQRQDALSFDAVAAARLRSGDTTGARAAIGQALAVGIQDPRLFVHAAAIDLAGGDTDAAMRHVAAATAGLAVLLPSERRWLDAVQQRL